MPMRGASCIARKSRGMSESPDVLGRVGETMKLHELTLRQVRLPLVRPYVLSYRTFTEFEPIILEVRDGDGRIGWGEGHISPGSSSETREGGWAFCREQAAALIGKTTGEAKATVAGNAAASKVAATALLTAIEMLEEHPLLRIDRDDEAASAHAFQQHYAKGNRGWRSSGCSRTAFARSRSRSARTRSPISSASKPSSGRLPVGPRCGSMPIAPTPKPMRAALRPGWSRRESNCLNSRAVPRTGRRTLVAAMVSTVPIMLDEPICTLADVKRAAGIRNVGFCKLKLKRFGGLDLLREALDTVRQFGMQPVLGDGLSSELGCWMEACIASVTIDNAGEFNGFLKPKLRLFAEPLQFSDGELVLSAGFVPTIDRDVLAAHEIVYERFG